jgi:tRNA-dihydrouridine synthase B
LNNTIKIGPHALRGRALLAPMAGLTDQPFRNICRNFGAAAAASEMSSSDTRLWNSRKSETRLNFTGENGLKILQIAGSEPTQLATAAKAAVDLGADIIDINMGCPAKKVCKKSSGSALLQDEALVSRILEAVTSASEVPVTLKIRTGWNPANRNGVRVARMAEAAGIAALAVHGRTRACMFKGDVEYHTIRDIKSAVSIPVFANGDISTVDNARDVLEYTGADAVMIGRGALGRPWFFSELNNSLNAENTGEKITNWSVSHTEQRATILLHLDALYRLYGDDRGVRIGRKHLSWYCKYLQGAEEFRNCIVRIESATDQLRLTDKFLTNFRVRERQLINQSLSGEYISAKKTIKEKSGDHQTESRV